MNFLKEMYQRFAVTSREKKYLADLSRPLRLHLGCGPIRAPEFCNVDLLPSAATDVVDDVSTLVKFRDNSVSEIYACHVLEHFGHDAIPSILNRWKDVLEPGGILRISVPDMDRIVKIYMDNFAHFQIPGNTPWIGLIWGGQTTHYDFHKTGFNPCWLRYLLTSSGFVECQEYPHKPHFAGLEDASLAHEPFGQFLSLNMMCRKPAL
jgi:SAM-dependent methyltransferase